MFLFVFFFFFFFKQKTAYEMRISDWSSDVCSSDLWLRSCAPYARYRPGHRYCLRADDLPQLLILRHSSNDHRSEEHTSELQSLMRISYAVFCLKKNITTTTKQYTSHISNTIITTPVI